MSTPIQYLRRALQELATIKEVKDKGIDPGETLYLPASDGVDVSGYSKKTITFLFDADLNYGVEISNDRTNWIEIYSATGVRFAAPWWQFDCYYTRLKVTNPLGTSQRIIVCHFLGRRLA